MSQAPFCSDAYLQPAADAFIQNPRIFEKNQLSHADYDRSFIKSDNAIFGQNAYGTSPFVRPHYPHFPFSTHPMTSATSRLPTPILCQWIEVSEIC